MAGGRGGHGGSGGAVGNLKRRASGAFALFDLDKALARADFEEGESPVALSFPWHGDPSHARLHAVASGICAALPRTLPEEMP